MVNEQRKVAAVMALIFLVLIALCVGYLFVWMPMETKYSYDVKAEQVYDNNKIEQSISLDSLSEDERTILYRAFKKSDHFFGGDAGVTVTTEERLETFNGWRVVDFQGVYIVVAIDGPETVERAGTVLWFPVTILLSFFIIFFLASVSDVLNPPRY